MATAFACALELRRRCDEISAAFRDARQAYDNGNLDPATLHAVAELSALNLHSQLETFLEELFLSCALGESGLEVDRLIQSISRESALSLLRRSPSSDADFVTWLPIATTLERARIHFLHGRPFSRLAYRPSILGGMKELTTTRNAVAHPSQRAAIRFRSMVDAKGYPATRPADFLLSIRDGAMEVEHQIALARAVGRGLAEPAESDVETVLGPERRFDSGERNVPPGDYVCVACSTTVVLPGGGHLDVCPCAGPVTTVCPACGQSEPCPTCSRPRKIVSHFERQALT